jgi:predicted permease
MSDSTEKTRFRFWLWLIALIGVIVPRRLRADWRQEWEAELRYRETQLEEWDRLDWTRRIDLLRRSTSAFWDALWLQRLRWEDDMLQDLRYGVRMMIKNPGFTFVAALTLALGIGANTALFTVMDAVMLKTLPVRDPEQLVVFRCLGSTGWYKGFIGSNDKDAATGLEITSSMSYGAFERFRDQSQTMASVFAFASLGRLNVNVDGEAEIASGQVVTGNYFAGLGISPALGRTLTTEDDRIGAAAGAVISHRYWQRRFGGDQEVIGKAIYISGSAFTIAGVTPPRFFGTLEVGSAPDITVPMGLLAQVSRRHAEFQQRSASNWWLQIMGRLKPGVSAGQAQAEVTAILQQHALELPNESDAERVAPQIKLESGSQGLMRQRLRFSSQFDILMVIVALVLLIACVNLANLSVGRAATRQREIAVRLAVGAGRLRVIRQLLTESMLLASLGAALGLLLAYWGKDVLLGLLVGSAEGFAVDLRLDWRALGFTSAVSVLTGLVFGLAPALHATRFDLAPTLKATSGGALPARSRLSKALVITQVAMSLVLLVGAGLFVRTLRNLNQIDAGFDRENLLIFSVNPRLEASRRASLYQQLTERIAAVPGVLAVGSSRFPLLGFSYTGESITVPGYTPSADEDMNVRTAEVSPNFLATMGIPLLLGREFTTQDNQQAPNAAVVSQSLTARFFPNQNPLGQRLIMDGIEMQIIGVARDAKYGGIREDVVPVVYLPYLQNQPTAPAELSFAVRTVVDPVASVAAIREAVQSIDRNLPMFNVRSQSELIALSFTRERLFATLSSFFGLLALALVSIGLYGVMSYTVARRTHEIGIRMALGAQSGSVLRMVMGESLGLVLAGSTIGLVAALAATRLVAGMLFGLTPTDPLTIALATLLLLAVATVSAWLPARRAARIDPLLALRHE